MPPHQESLIDEIIAIASDEYRTPADEADIIARTYHRLCVALAGEGDVGYEDLNWAGFAQWSSKAIGVSLRLENKSPFWKRTLKAFRVPSLLGPPVRAITRWLLGGAYGRGLTLANRAIFLEIATVYANVLDDKSNDEVWRSATFDTSVLAGPADRGLLRMGADLLELAMSETDRSRRSELVLGASVALSVYEQARVQPCLEFVAYRPVRWLLRVSWRMPLALIGRPPCRFDIYTQPHRAQPRLVRWLEERWARLYSRVLVVDLPTEPLRMALDLNPPGSFRPALERPQHPVVGRLVEQFRSANDPERNQGVRNWLGYEERMRYIIGYFMMYQNVPEMFEAPFRSQTIRPIRQGLRNLSATLTRIIVHLPSVADPSLVEKHDLDPVKVHLRGRENDESLSA